MRGGAVRGAGAGGGAPVSGRGLGAVSGAGALDARPVTWLRCWGVPAGVRLGLRHGVAGWALTRPLRAGWLPVGRSLVALATRRRPTAPATAAPVAPARPAAPAAPAASVGRGAGGASGIGGGLAPGAIPAPPQAPLRSGWRPLWGGRRLGRSGGASGAAGRRAPGPGGPPGRAGRPGRPGGAGGRPRRRPGGRGLAVPEEAGGDVPGRVDGPHPAEQGPDRAPPPASGREEEVGGAQSGRRSRRCSAWAPAEAPSPARQNASARVRCRSARSGWRVRRPAPRPRRAR